VKKVEENRELPLDVLDIISKTLDFDDHFQFAGVCKNWRAFHKIYWRTFLASQEPLLLQLQISYLDEESYSFISIPDQRVYHLEMMKYFPSSTYVTCSSGYFITAGDNNNSFILINPFTRIKKVINSPASENSIFLTNRALFAFDKCSEEFVFVVLCNSSLHVYQSRNYDWVTCSTMGNSETVVDFVVLHNIIYVVTNMANIGVLSLNSANVKFLKLKSTPSVNFSPYLKLVNCDEQLLVVDFTSNEISNVYKIDFSTMNYFRLETLGDIALFCGLNCLKRNCYALSNPNRWGYECNSVYDISLLSTICSVYSGNDKKLQKSITLPAPDAPMCLMLDWCFRHQQYEIDYSLVE
jgi:hypothetical protein